jgi:hypothetical protein
MPGKKTEKEEEARKCTISPNIFGSCNGNIRIRIGNVMGSKFCIII